MTQSMNVAEFPFAVEDFLRPLARKAEGAWERTEELNDLRDVIIVLAVFGARLGVEEVVSSYQFENLLRRSVITSCNADTS